MVVNILEEFDVEKHLFMFLNCLKINVRQKENILVRQIFFFVGGGVAFVRLFYSCEDISLL